MISLSKDKTRHMQHRIPGPLRVFGTLLQGLYVFARRLAPWQSRTILYSMQLYVQTKKLIIDEITVF
jgi:hypothetical protein